MGLLHIHEENECCDWPCLDHVAPPLKVSYGALLLITMQEVGKDSYLKDGTLGRKESAGALYTGKGRARQTVQSDAFELNECQTASQTGM